MTKGNLFERGGGGLNRGSTVISVIESCRNTEKAAAGASYLTRSSLIYQMVALVCQEKNLKWLTAMICVVSSQSKVKCTVLVHRWKRENQKNDLFH